MERKGSKKISSPDIRLALGSQTNDMSCFLIPEVVGVEASLITDGLVEAVKTRATSAAPGTVHDQRDAPFNGFAGVRFEIDGLLAGQPAHRAIWVASKNGYCYQIQVLGPKRETSEINTALDEMCDRLRPIERDRLAHANGFDPATDFESPRFGYRVELGGTLWTHAQPAANNAIIAEYLAQYKDSAVLAVYHFQMTDKVSDLDSISKALMEVRGLTYPGPDTISTKLIEAKQAKPWPALSSRLRISRLPKDASWCKSSLPIIRHSWQSAACYTMTPKLERSSKSAGSRKGFFAPPDSSRPWSESLRAANGLVNNKLAIMLQQKGDMAGSVDFLKVMNEIRPEDEQILNNYINALMLSDRPQEALKAITDSVNSATQNSPLLCAPSKNCSFALEIRSKRDRSSSQTIQERLLQRNLLDVVC